MKQNQYKLEDFKVGQKVKVLVDLGSYISEMQHSRLGQVGEITEVDFCSVNVLFTTTVAVGEDDYFDQWYRPEEILPLIGTSNTFSTNAERQDEINRLEAEIQTLNNSVVELKRQIKANPEKIKAEAGDTVKFTYKALGECYMFVMQKEQGVFFDPSVESYQGDFVFVGPDGRNPVEVVNTGSHVALEFRKKGDCVWIDSKEVDWSGILN